MPIYPSYDKSFEPGIIEYAAEAERWFKVQYSDTDVFEARLRAGLSLRGNDPHAEDKIGLTRSLNLFSLELFEAMICGGHPYKPMFVSALWDRLRAFGVVFKAMGHMEGTPFVDHQINRALLQRHLLDGTFLNLFLAPARLPDRYQDAVASIDVRKQGDEFRGTGFIVLHDEQPCFVTCRHNVDQSEEIEITAVTLASGKDLLLGPITLSDKYDIATARLKTEIKGPLFALSDQVEVFDEVYTLGYPFVPRVDPILFGHRGEVNGRAMLYMERCPTLIISNLVSPGSSGGPVLTRDGHCVGMTAKWLEGQRLEAEGLETMRFSAALPAGLLREAVEATPQLR